MSAAVVWVPHQVDLDYSKAERFGTLEFITDRGISGHPTSPRDVAIRQKMAEVIDHQFRADDFVLYSGSPYTNLQFMAMLAQSRVFQEHGVQVLRWSSIEGDYQVMKLIAKGE